MFTKEENEKKTSEISQHLAYSCFELVGRSYLLKFDDERTYFIKLLDEQTALFGQIGKSPTLEHYRCMKGHTHVYFLHLDLKVKPVYNITFIIDTETKLVTMVEPHQKDPENYPHWFADDITFGYIDIVGTQPPKERHTYTTDLIGSKIEWHYCERDKVTHIYKAKDRVLLAHVPFEEMSDAEKQVHMIMVNNGAEPFEEPAAYIKIKEDLYLLCFCEPNQTHKLIVKGGGGILLMDMKRVMDVGIFLDIDKNGDAMFTLVSADGSFKYQDFAEESLPSCYDVFYSLDGNSCKENR